uniref:Uncharacterized protein n=1 Tax=Myotis myotis TaxID=51298 RepID=A0A7J7Z403_MYOMY|nr:hypothetical protein mMyoMyo1_010392 [Myotis myotis]
MVKRSKTCIHLIKDPLKYRVKYMKKNCQTKMKNKFIYQIMEAFNNAFPATDRTRRKNKSVGNIRLNNTITLSLSAYNTISLCKALYSTSTECMLFLLVLKVHKRHHIKLIVLTSYKYTHYAYRTDWKMNKNRLSEGVRDPPKDLYACT